MKLLVCPFFESWKVLSADSLQSKADVRACTVLSSYVSVNKEA
jgi:hypothetical protein